jgi:hypothetical protein
MSFQHSIEGGLLSCLVSCFLLSSGVSRAGWVIAMGPDLVIVKAAVFYQICTVLEVVRLIFVVFWSGHGRMGLALC